MSVAAASILLPTDPLERRRLWREWIERDAPGEPIAVRRATPRASSRPGDEAWLNEAIPHPPGIVAGLRSEIDETIHDGQITISDRGRLMRRAMQVGLSRFEASLLIAAVLHQAGGTPPRRTTTVRGRGSWTVSRMVTLGLIAETIAIAVAFALTR